MRADHSREGEGALHICLRRQMTIKTLFLPTRVIALPLDEALSTVLVVGRAQL